MPGLVDFLCHRPLDEDVTFQPSDQASNTLPCRACQLSTSTPITSQHLPRSCNILALKPGLPFHIEGQIYWHWWQTAESDSVSLVIDIRRRTSRLIHEDRTFATVWRTTWSNLDDLGFRARWELAATVNTVGGRYLAIINPTTFAWPLLKPSADGTLDSHYEGTNSLGLNASCYLTLHLPWNIQYPPGSDRYYLKDLQLAIVAPKTHKKLQGAQASLDTYPHTLDA